MFEIVKYSAEQKNNWNQFQRMVHSYLIATIWIIIQIGFAIIH